MARKVWIAIDGFGLFLFLLFDVWIVWYATTPQWKPTRLGTLLPVGFITWRIYLTLLERIKSKPGQTRKKDTPESDLESLT